MVEFASTEYEARHGARRPTGTKQAKRGRTKVVIPSLQHIEQRVGVFVDVQNLYYSARYNYGSKVSFVNILKDAVGRRKLVRAIAYVIRADPKEESFFNALEKIGYEAKAKDMQIFFGGAKKGDWDIGIAIDAIELAPRLDVIVLVSGDGDFLPLLEHLKRALGCRVEVVAFGKTASSRLVQEADSFLDLDSNTRRYLINGHSGRVPADSRREKR